MIDIKLLRSNPDFVKAAVKKREMNLDDVIDEMMERAVSTAETIEVC